MANRPVEGTRHGAPRRRPRAAGIVAIVALLGGCAQSGEFELGLGFDRPQTSDIATASAGAGSHAELERATAYWSEQHAKNPRDPKAALSYARNLKALNQKAQALTVLQSTYMFASTDREFLSEYGRLALEHGQISAAEKLLEQADDPGRPDWRVTSARGTVRAKQGRFKEAIQFFERARTLAPGQASVLSNLAMAYTMDGQAARGAALLQEAVAAEPSNDRLRRNLELVMSLQQNAAPVQAAEEQRAAPPVRAAAQTAPITTASTRPAAWNAPLPIEGAGRPARSPSAGSATVVDPDDIVRRALAAEHTKPARR